MAHFKCSTDVCCFAIDVGITILCKEEKLSALTEAPWENQSHEASP